MKNREKIQNAFVDYQVDNMSISELKSFVSAALHDDYSNETDNSFLEILDYSNFIIN